MEACPSPLRPTVAVIANTAQAIDACRLMARWPCAWRANGDYSRWLAIVTPGCGSRGTAATIATNASAPGRRRSEVLPSRRRMARPLPAGLLVQGLEMLPVRRSGGEPVGLAAEGQLQDERRFVLIETVSQSSLFNPASHKRSVKNVLRRRTRIDDGVDRCARPLAVHGPSGAIFSIVLAGPVRVSRMRQCLGCRATDAAPGPGRRVAGGGGRGRSRMTARSMRWQNWPGRCARGASRTVRRRRCSMRNSPMRAGGFRTMCLLT